MNKCIALFLLLSMAVSHGVVFCGNDDDVPEYSISAWEGENKQWDYPKSYYEKPALKSYASEPSNEPEEVYDFELQEEGAVTRILTFLKNFRRKVPTLKKMKCIVKNAAVAGVIIGGVVLSGSALIKAAKCLGARVKGLIVGTSKMATIVAAFYLLGKIASGR